MEGGWGVSRRGGSKVQPGEVARFRKPRREKFLGVPGMEGG